MEEVDELKKQLQDLKKNLHLGEIKKEVKRLEIETIDPGFWQDQEKARAKMKKLARLQEEITQIRELEELIASGQIGQAQKKLAKTELKVFLSGKYDSLPALLSIHAGQGGVEAMDWAQMLQRMYVQYFKNKDWDFEVLEKNFGEEAGIKSVTLSVNEPLAYGNLKFEAGTHRLVRQSPFNADQLRQTSFALVEVLPQIEEEAGEIALNEDDLEWQFFRSSTQGGQNVQKVSTAVRVRHKPTDLVVTCQTQRYQEQNRKIALKLLRAKLWQQKKDAQVSEIKKLKKGRTKAAWGTQIRSYVLHPYKMVKDLRTNLEIQNAEAVLDGDLDDLISAEIRQLTRVDLIGPNA